MPAVHQYRGETPGVDRYDCSCVDLLSANLFLIKCNPYHVLTDWTFDVNLPTFRRPITCNIEQPLVPAAWTRHLSVLFFHLSSPLLLAT